MAYTKTVWTSLGDWSLSQYNGTDPHWILTMEPSIHKEISVAAFIDGRLFVNDRGLWLFAVQELRDEFPLLGECVRKYRNLLEMSGEDTSCDSDEELRELARLEKALLACGLDPEWVADNEADWLADAGLAGKPLWVQVRASLDLYAEWNGGAA